MAKRFSDDVAYMLGVIDKTDPDSYVRRVMLVGAKTHRDNPDRLTDRDRSHLYHAFSAATQLNIAIHPDFEIDVVNIHPAYGGRSFLKEQTQADMAVLCFVFNPEPDDIPHVPYHSDPVHEDRFTDIDQARPNIWHDSAVRVGAKIVTTIIGDDAGYSGGHITEINHRHFLNVPDAQFVQMDNFDQRYGLTTMCHRDFRLS